MGKARHLRGLGGDRDSTVKRPLWEPAGAQGYYMFSRLRRAITVT